MSGTPRAFDDGRFPDADGKSDCFLCGKKIDPLDPARCRYSPNAAAFDGLPAHRLCLAGQDPDHLYVIATAALNTMSEAQIKKSLRDAELAT